MDQYDTPTIPDLPINETFIKKHRAKSTFFMRDLRGFMLFACSQGYLAALEGVRGLDASAGLDSGCKTFDVLLGTKIRIVVRRDDFLRLAELQDFDQVTHPLVTPNPCAERRPPYPRTPRRCIALR